MVRIKNFYGLNDAIGAVQYPSGRVINYGVHEAGRVSKVSAGVKTYADLTVNGQTNPYPYAPDGRIANAWGQLAAEYSTETPATGTSYPFTDMLGSVRAVSNSSGSLSECYDYLPFGRMLDSADNGRSSAGCYPNLSQPLSSRLPQ